MNVPEPRPRPDIDRVREAIQEHPEGSEQEQPDAGDPYESEDRADSDDPAEELDLDLPPNESAPGHNPDTDEEQ